MRYHLGLLTMGLVLSSVAHADEPLLLKNTNNTLALSIYNQNLALVKDSRPADIKAGITEVIFDGVAQEIQPETAIIYGQGVRVTEQNYSYNLMTNANLINQSIGQEVTTVRTNPENGENIFEKAVIVASTHGTPVLKFPYGIDAGFSGRIVFDKIPANVSEKPMLTAKINNKQAGHKNLNLAYLTNGLSWKTDYVAMVGGRDKLDLTGWVTINNESGIDYNNAKIQLVAGDVNVVRNNIQPRMMFKAMNAMTDSIATQASITPESINSYELYTLPNITTIKNKQTKQVSLLERKNVTFAKEFNLHSQLYFGGNDEFEKVHPEIIYVINNTKNSNLGISLPAGTVRFYENDKNGNLQFTGSTVIGNTAKEDTLRLALGEAFNITARGKVLKSVEKEISRMPQQNCAMIKTLKTYSAEIEINNAEDFENTIVVSQSFPNNFEVIKENIKGTSKNESTREWQVKVPANSKGKLSFDVEITQSRRSCD